MKPGRKEIEWTHQFLVYAHGENLLGEDINATDVNTETLADPGK
jgi:hypothetical protein